MYSALEIAKYIVLKCINDKHPISNLQLQKILYYIQKNFLQSKNERAFADDIEAWQFGPVVPNVYYHFCAFGSMSIIFYLGTLLNEINYDDKSSIDAIVEEKRKINVWDLVNDTHKPNGAWAKIYKNGEGNHHVIPINLIQKEG